MENHECLHALKCKETKNEFLGRHDFVKFTPMCKPRLWGLDDLGDSNLVKMNFWDRISRPKTTDNRALIPKAWISGWRNFLLKIGFGIPGTKEKQWKSKGLDFKVAELSPQSWFRQFPGLRKKKWKWWV